MDIDHAKTDLETDELKIFVVSPYTGMAGLASEAQSFYFKTLFKKPCAKMRFAVEVRNAGKASPLVWLWSGEGSPPSHKFDIGRYDWRLRTKTQCAGAPPWKTSAWSKWMTFELK